MHYDAVLDLDFAVESFFMILVKSSIKACFCEEMVAAIVKPCIVIVLDIHFKHTLWRCAIDLDFALQWPSHDFTSSLASKCVSV